MPVDLLCGAGDDDCSLIVSGLVESLVAVAKADVDIDVGEDEDVGEVDELRTRHPLLQALMVITNRRNTLDRTQMPMITPILVVSYSWSSSSTSVSEKGYIYIVVGLNLVYTCSSSSKNHIVLFEDDLLVFYWNTSGTHL